MAGRTVFRADAEKMSSLPSSWDESALERIAWRRKRVEREGSSRDKKVEADEMMKVGCREPIIGMVFARTVES